MQEDREILAYRAKAQPDHVFRRRPHHDEIAVLHRQAEQAVTNGAADDEGLHGASGVSVPRRSGRPCSGAVSRLP